MEDTTPKRFFRSNLLRQHETNPAITVRGKAKNHTNKSVTSGANDELFHTTTLSKLPRQDRPRSIAPNTQVSAWP